MAVPMQSHPYFGFSAVRQNHDARLPDSRSTEAMLHRRIGHLRLWLGVALVGCLAAVGAVAAMANSPTRASLLAQLQRPAKPAPSLSGLGGRPTAHGRGAIRGG